MQFKQTKTALRNEELRKGAVHRWEALLCELNMKRETASVDHIEEAWRCREAE